MTFAETADRYAPRPEIVGPCSDWPRRRRRGGVRPAAVAASIAAAGIFLHCAAPLLD